MESHEMTHKQKICRYTIMVYIVAKHAIYVFFFSFFFFIAKHHHALTSFVTQVCITSTVHPIMTRIKPFFLVLPLPLALYVSYPLHVYIYVTCFENVRASQYKCYVKYTYSASFSCIAPHWSVVCWNIAWIAASSESFPIAVSLDDGSMDSWVEDCVVDAAGEGCSCGCTRCCL